MNGERRDRNRAVFSLLQSVVSAGGALSNPKEVASLAKKTSSQLRACRGSATTRLRTGRSTTRRFRTLEISGAISAGLGDPTDPTELGSIPVDLAALNIAATTRTFALRVRGDSMRDAHIADGDLVVIEAREPKVGDIVAALIDGETTLKRFVTEDGQIFLRAENKNYPDRIPLRDLTIQGVMRAVVRVCNSVL